MSDAGEDRGSRAAFRAFVKAHHPDVGGDHDEFVVGIARHRGPDGVPPEGEARFDAPVIFVMYPRGFAGAVHRVKRWRRRRRRPPRVH